MTFIIDASFAHASMTPAALRSIGASGAILYAGCDFAPKNATRAEVQALLDDGLHVGLVIENFAQDALKGAPEGARQGRNLRAAAARLGYDVDHCVLFAGADWNTWAQEQSTVDAFMGAFSAEVAVAGFYGNSYAIDFVHLHGHAQVFWQSDSEAFSYGPSPRAHLLQRYNDPRARGLALDVNDIQLTPLMLMGEDMALSDADAQKVADLVWAKPITDTVAGQVATHLAAEWLANTNIAERDDATSAQVADLKVAVQQIVTAGGGTVDLAALAAALAPLLAPLLAQHIQITSK